MWRRRQHSPMPSALASSRSSDRSFVWLPTTNVRSCATGRSPRNVSWPGCAAHCRCRDGGVRPDRPVDRSGVGSRRRSSAARRSATAALRRSTTEGDTTAMSERTTCGHFAHRFEPMRYSDERTDRMRPLGSSLGGGGGQLGVKVTGRRAGPKIAVVEGFHSISPSTARSGIRRARIGSASCSSARASAAPRQ